MAISIIIIEAFHKSMTTPPTTPPTLFGLVSSSSRCTVSSDWLMQLSLHLACVCSPPSETSLRTDCHPPPHPRTTPTHSRQLPLCTLHGRADTRCRAHVAFCFANSARPDAN